MKSLVHSSGIAAFLAILLFFAANVVFREALPGSRIDLTEDGLYTISDSTRGVLRALPEPIVVTWYFSETVARDFPQFFAHGRRVTEMLRDYESIAGGKLRLEIVDPEPFSEAEDRALAAGMTGVPTAGGRQIFMGVVVRDLTDRESTIPLLGMEREALLEYDLTRLIAGLDVAEKPRVGLITSLPMEGGGMAGFGRPPAPPWVIHDQLSQFFELVDIEIGFTVLPDDLDLLLLIHPGELADVELYAIDQYVMAGGRVAAFLDPFSEIAGNAAQTMGMGPGESSGLGPLLASWGVEMVPGKIVGDLELAQRVNMGGGGPRAIRDLVIWLAARGDAISATDPVTANLDQINLASAGALVPLGGSGVTIEPLLQSSTRSGLLDASEARGLPEPDSLIRKLEPDGERHILLARIRGEISSAFPDGPPEGAYENLTLEERAAHLARSQGPVTLLVGTDSDLFENRFWVQTQEFFGQRMAVPIAGNGDLLINAVEQLTGSDALLGLRGRGVTQRPFTVVEDIRREAEQRYLAEEKALQDELANTEARLSELQSFGAEGEVLLSPAQEAEIARFRQRTLEIRQQLRGVQRNLVRDIESLGERLAILNIALVPALLVIIAIALATMRRRARSRRTAP